MAISKASEALSGRIQDQGPQVLFGKKKGTQTATFQVNLTSVGCYTPLKFNMEPENGTLEKEIPFGNHHFQVLC